MRMIRISTVAAAVVALVALAAPAFAHVTANPSEGPQEGRVTTFFNVGHGCDSDGPNTTQLSIQIPEGVIGATPEDEPGWTAETKMRKLDEPIEGEGEEITEVVSEVIWTADEPLDEHAFRQFGIGLNIAAPGEEVLYFPTVQQCEEGAIRWVNIPDSLEAWGDTEDPAPYLELAPAEEEGATDTAALTEDDVRAIVSEAPASDTTESTNTPTLLAGGALVVALIALVLSLRSKPSA